MRAYIGIDPGKQGAAVMITADGRYFIHDWESEKAAAAALRRWQCEFELMAAIERIFYVNRETKNKKGGQIFGNLKLLTNFGIWLGLLTAYGIDYDQIAPRTWQSKILIPSISKKTKNRSFETVRELFPGVKQHIYLKKHNGRADAFLIAMCLKRANEFKLKAGLK